jgi:hypothetical protein
MRWCTHEYMRTAPKLVQDPGSSLVDHVVGRASKMHETSVAQFDIAARYPDVLGRVYALLFGWRFSPDGADARKLSVMTARALAVSTAREKRLSDSQSDVTNGGVARSGRGIARTCFGAFPLT